MGRNEVQAGQAARTLRKENVNSHGTTEETHRQASKKRPEEGPPPCGYCYNCNTRVDDGIAFCEDYCAQEWRRQAELRRKEGRPR
jgi:hypothetical protein